MQQVHSDPFQKENEMAYSRACCDPSPPRLAVCGFAPVDIPGMVLNVTTYEALLPLNLRRAPWQPWCVTLSAPLQLAETGDDDAATVAVELALYKGRVFSDSSVQIGDALTLSMPVLSGRIASMTPLLVLNVPPGDYIARLSFTVTGAGIVAARGLLNATAVVTSA